MKPDSVHSAAPLAGEGSQWASREGGDAAPLAEGSDLAEIRKLAQAIIDEAFTMAPPNPHTPRLVMLAHAIQRAAMRPL